MVNRTQNGIFINTFGYQLLKISYFTTGVKNQLCLALKIAQPLLVYRARKVPQEHSKFLEQTPFNLLLLVNWCIVHLLLLCHTPSKVKSGKHARA